MKIHVFNPENDLALANGSPGFMAPASAQQLRKDLHWLPNWWAKEGDLVWDGISSLTLQDDDEIVPWGWSPALVHQLKRAGVKERFLPSLAKMEQLRQLSSRHTAVKALKQLKNEDWGTELFCGDSHICSTMEEVLQLIAEWKTVLFKSPWSSSGKGLLLSSAPNINGWTKNILRQQGSIIGERWLNKHVDFALEFMCDGNGEVIYRGLSLFHTGTHGAYIGNWLTKEDVKITWLAQYVPIKLLHMLIEWWTQYLRKFKYKGPVGIDMMCCEEGLCPCVEINWRMTMGMVAILLAEQGKEGKFLIHYVDNQYVAEITPL